MTHADLGHVRPMTDDEIQAYHQGVADKRAGVHHSGSFANEGLRQAYEQGYLMADGEPEYA